MAAEGTARPPFCSWYLRGTAMLAGGIGAVSLVAYLALRLSPAVALTCFAAWLLPFMAVFPIIYLSWMLEQRPVARSLVFSAGMLFMLVGASWAAGYSWVAAGILSSEFAHGMLAASLVFSPLFATAMAIHSVRRFKTRGEGRAPAPRDGDPGHARSPRAAGSKRSLRTGALLFGGHLAFAAALLLLAAPRLGIAPGRLGVPFFLVFLWSLSAPAYWMSMRIGSQAPRPYALRCAMLFFVDLESLILALGVIAFWLGLGAPAQLAVVGFGPLMATLPLSLLVYAFALRRRSRAAARA